MIQQALNYLSAGAAFIAAALWFWSSVAKVESKYKENLPEGVKFLNFHGGQGPIKIEKDGKRIDVIASLDWQSRLNSYAAFAAGIAAILQSIALGFPFV
jgi:hypothetical protein